MYTDTTRPNHLAQEVIDNAVDEALAGHANDDRGHGVRRRLAARSCDDGRGMPVDIHPAAQGHRRRVDPHQLHSGAKFTNNNYKFSRRPARRRRVGGQCAVDAARSHGQARRQRIRAWTFRDGDEASKLEAGRHGGKTNTGTRVRFWPDPKYFDTPKFQSAAAQARAARQGGAVPRPDRSSLFDEASREEIEWHYENGLRDYLMEGVKGAEGAAAASLSSASSRASAKKPNGRWLWVPEPDGELIAGKLRQPDSDRAGRHARQRPAHRPRPMRCASSASSATCCRAA